MTMQQIVRRAARYVRAAASPGDRVYYRDRAKRVLARARWREEFCRMWARLGAGLSWNQAEFLSAVSGRRLPGLAAIGLAPRRYRPRPAQGVTR
jgi:hypothetical protein